MRARASFPSPRPWIVWRCSGRSPKRGKSREDGSKRLVFRDLVVGLGLRRLARLASLLVSLRVQVVSCRHGQHLQPRPSAPKGSSAAAVFSSHLGVQPGSGQEPCAPTASRGNDMAIPSPKARLPGRSAPAPQLTSLAKPTGSHNGRSRPSGVQATRTDGSTEVELRTWRCRNLTRQF